VLFRQPWTEHVGETMRAFLGAGGEAHPARSMMGAAVVLGALVSKLELAKKRPYVIGPGGSSPVGAVGYVDAGLELALQIDAGEAPEPDVIFVPAGSGGTVVGLALGLAAAGLMTRIVAVRVTNRLAIHPRRLARLAARTVATIRAHDPRFPDVTDLAMKNVALDVAHRGAGYGVPTEEGERAAALAAKDGVVLDPTYTAKAFAALVAAAERGEAGKRALFLHTLSSARMAPLLVGAPAVPAWAHEGRG
jgi:1-aminocyclopropane-1-carboxylate deaminase/D-cysteine desulfhydrase-like pyridoxal-dependent ACC family enzyme